jgi:iron complex transport system permease protein
MVGSIGFVGLVIPHAARFLVGPAHRRLLPATALGGAIYMVGADIISRIIIGAPEEVLTEDMIGRVFGVRAHVRKSAVHGRHHIQYVMD